jgi:hypothetical protein
MSTNDLRIVSSPVQTEIEQRGFHSAPGSEILVNGTILQGFARRVGGIEFSAK